MAFLGDPAIIPVEFDQGLRMLRDEGDRRHHQRHAFGAGPADFVVGRWTDPFERSDTALVTHPPIKPWFGQDSSDRRRGPLHLSRIGIASVDDFLG